MSESAATEIGSAQANIRDRQGRLLTDRELPLPALLWRELGVPAALAFVARDRRGRWLAVCPSPAGATKHPLPGDAWGEVALAVPLIAELDPDREALLVWGGQHRAVDDRAGDLEVFLAPRAICDGLVGGVGPLWRGFDGGDQAWRAIDSFIAELRARASSRDGSPPDCDSEPG
ncbi:MAG TPA: DUF5947 family protein [Polyangia bacterium]|nr:DUF5947 family protein [Polyangia bacterium]